MLPLLKIKTKTPVPVPGQLNANTRMPPQQNIQPVMIPEPQTEASSVEVETDNPDNSENSQK